MRTRSSTQGGFACRYGFRAASEAARSAAGASGSGEAIGRGFGFTFGFRAASGAARSAAGASGSCAARADCAAAQSGIRNAIRRRPLTLAGARLRTNGRPAPKRAFRAASGAARRAAGASGSAAARADCAAAQSGIRNGFTQQPFTLAVVLPNDAARRAAPNQRPRRVETPLRHASGTVSQAASASGSDSEPRAEQRASAAGASGST